MIHNSTALRRAMRWSFNSSSQSILAKGFAWWSLLASVTPWPPSALQPVNI